MKKLIIIILIIALTVFTSCYSGWKTVKINGVGSLKVPENWVYTEEDGLAYFTDRPIDEDDCGIYLVEPIITRDNVGNDIISNKLFGDAKYIDIITGTGLSNSAGYGQEEYEQDGRKITKYVIWLYGEKRCPTLIAWDDLVDEETIKKIAESYLVEIEE